jgi:hypothetical protein
MQQVLISISFNSPRPRLFSRQTLTCPIRELARRPPRRFELFVKIEVSNKISFDSHARGLCGRPETNSINLNTRDMDNVVKVSELGSASKIAPLFYYVPLNGGAQTFSYSLVKWKPCSQNGSLSVVNFLVPEY